MSQILVVDDDPTLHELIEAALTSDGHTLHHAFTGQEGLKMLERGHFDLTLIDYVMPGMDGGEFLDQLRQNYPDLKAMMITGFGTPEAVLSAMRKKVCDFILKPFSIADLKAAVSAALGDCAVVEIEVLSAEPHWVQLRVPCDLAAVPILQKLLIQLKADLPEDTREAMAYAFREMLNNAIEHGGKLDPTKSVEVLCVRTKRAIIYWIKDPGEGFDPQQLEHAAVNNPANDPFRHVTIRDEKGLRAGGFGILMTDQLVDELVYNEQRNELMFVKYL
ncbi:MAG TPA: response regulator [Blastocatellia bacterium]|jgi:CheY-like chemotaxis protein/anti-sigma regulatory factor (Ser/Thr protein kinase)